MLYISEALWETNIFNPFLLEMNKSETCLYFQIVIYMKNIKIEILQ